MDTKLNIITKFADNMLNINNNNNNPEYLIIVI